VGKELRPCEMLELEAFNGQTGNQIASLGHALVLAQDAGMRRVWITPAITPSTKLDWHELDHILLRPTSGYLDLPAPAGSACERPLPKRCEKMKRHLQNSMRSRGAALKYWNEFCIDVPASEYHDVLQKYLEPLLDPQCRPTVAPQSPAAAAQKTLTVHLRTGDVWQDGKAQHSKGKKGILWWHPPCAFYEKLVREESFTHLQVVASPAPRHPCVAWLARRAKALGVQMRVQTKSPSEDYCTLLHAEHLAPSVSSFSASAAVFSSTLKNLYMYRGFWDSNHWMLNCRMSEQVRVRLYTAPQADRQAYGPGLESLTQFLNLHPVTQISEISCSSAERGGRRLSFFQ